MTKAKKVYLQHFLNHATNNHPAHEKLVISAMDAYLKQELKELKKEIKKHVLYHGTAIHIMIDQKLSSIK